MKKMELHYFIFKSFSLISFVFTTPLLLEGLGPSAFGVWSTISSFITWILVLDFGVGNYLRNRVTELSVKNENEQALIEYAKGLLVSTVVAAGVAVVLLGVSFLIDWSNLLGIKHHDLNPFLSIVCIIIFTSLSFVSNLIYFYYYGLQRASLVALMQSSGHLLFIFLIYVLGKNNEMTLFATTLAFGGSQLIPGTIASIKFFLQKKVKIQVSDLLNFSDSSVFKTGGKFFFIQLTALILFSTDKILLANIFGPAKVTEYEIIFRVLSLSVLFQSLLLTPAWGKYSESFFSNRMGTVKRQLKFHLCIFFFLGGASVTLGYFMNPILALWLGEMVDNKIFITALVIYFILVVWNNVFATFLNASNNIDLTFRICLFVIVFNLPASYLFAMTSLQETGIILGTILSLLPAALLTPIQTFMIINSRSRDQ